MPSLRLQDRVRPARASATMPAQLALPDGEGSWEQRAETAWLDAQVASFEIDDVRAELDAVTLRLGRATEWFEAHGREHPLYERAYARRAGLEQEERWIRIRRWSRMQRCWVASKDCWAALQQVRDREAWLAEFAPEVEDASTPVGFWRALQGGRRVPGEWPPVRDEAYVRAGRIEYWHRDQLAERLDRRRAIARSRTR